MPSFALQMLLLTYLRHSTLGEHGEARPFLRLLEQVLQEDLIVYDRFFTESDAAYVAAGVFFFGLKQEMPAATVVPTPVWSAWESTPRLRERFPNPLDLGTVENLLRWARLEGSSDPGVAEYLRGLRPFHKRGPGHTPDRGAIRSMPAVEPRFGVLYDYPDDAPAPKNQPSKKQPRKGWRAHLQTAVRRLANRHRWKTYLQTALRRLANRLDRV
jgi:hypothetical protein